MSRSSASRAPRVAVVIDPFDHPFNGTVVSTRRFVTALVDRGCDVRLLTIGDEPAVPGCERVGFQRLRIFGVNRIIDRMRAPLARPERSRLRAALADCDVLHVQFPFFLGFAAINEARRLGVPVICSFHVQPENILANLRLDVRWLRELAYRVFIRAFYDRADHVIAPSGFAAAALRDRGMSSVLTVLSNGVPEALFEVPHVARGACSRPFRILSVGRLSREKHPDTLLEAVIHSRHRQNLELTLVGAGPRQEALEAQARTLGINARIGPRDDAELMDLYRHADLFVHCGAAELEGMAVLEAMATGNAVVVADAPASAATTLLQGPRTRFRPDDPADLAERIDHWIEHDAARRAAGEANRRAALKYAHGRSADRLMALYLSCMTNCHERGPDAR